MDRQAPVNYKIHVLIAITLSIVIQLLALNANTGKQASITGAITTLKGRAKGQTAS